MDIISFKNTETYLRHQKIDIIQYASHIAITAALFNLFSARTYINCQKISNSVYYTYHLMIMVKPVTTNYYTSATAEELNSFNCDGEDNYVITDAFIS